MNGAFRTWAVLAIVLSSFACGGATPRAENQEPDPLDTVSPEELYRRGNLLLEAGDYIRAEQYLAAAIERGYPEDRAIPLLLRACVEASRLVAALEYARPYLLRNPEQWSLRLLVASIYLGLDEHAQAQRELERILETNPDEPQPHYLLGVLHRDALTDEDRAREHFRRYLALAPDGVHREEASAALTLEERGLPVRVELASEPEPGQESDASAPTGETDQETP